MAHTICRICDPFRRDFLLRHCTVRIRRCGSSACDDVPAGLHTRIESFRLQPSFFMFRGSRPDRVHCSSRSVNISSMLQDGGSLVLVSAFSKIIENQLPSDWTFEWVVFRFIRTKTMPRSCCLTSVLELQPIPRRRDSSLQTRIS